MTAIIGIKTNVGQEGIVIAADTQMSIYEGEKLVMKAPTYKIWSGDTWALAHSGSTDTNELKTFRSILTGRSKYDSSPEKVEQIIERAVNSEPPRLIELSEQVNALLDLRGESSDGKVSCIFAATKPKFGLWHVSEYGWLKTYNQISREKEEEDERPFEYLILGSGTQYLNESIKAQLEDENKPLDPENINLPVAIKVAHRAIKISQKDAQTGGPLDLVILTKERVDNYGKEIKKSIDEAERQKIEEISRRYL